MLRKLLAVLIVLACDNLLSAQSLPPPVPVAEPKGVVQPMPVVQPPPPKANTDKKVDIIPVPDENQGFMPSRFIKNQLGTMPIGSAGYIPVQAVKVDSYRRCWIDSQQVYGKKTDRNVVLITKDDSGFHVILEEINHQWEAGEFDGRGWLLAKTVRSSVK